MIPYEEIKRKFYGLSDDEEEETVPEPDDDEEPEPDDEPDWMAVGGGSTEGPPPAAGDNVIPMGDHEKALALAEEEATRQRELDLKGGDDR